MVRAVEVFSPVEAALQSVSGEWDLGDVHREVIGFIGDAVGFIDEFGAGDHLGDETGADDVLQVTGGIVERTEVRNVANTFDDLLGSAASVCIVAGFLI